MIIMQSFIFVYLGLLCMSDIQLEGPNVEGG